MDISDSTIVSRILARFREMTLAPKWDRPGVWISVTSCAAYAWSPGMTYAQEITPGVTVAVDDKETKEVQPLVERATPATVRAEHESRSMDAGARPGNGGGSRERIEEL